MLITPASINALFTGFETKWWQAYQASEIFWDQIASLTPSTTDRETHAWPARIPVMREWLGERVSNNMAPYVTTIINKDFELTEVINRNTIEDDQYDVFASPLLAMMGEAAKKNPDYLLVSALQAGTTTTIWDNQNFFDASHPVDMRDTSLGVQSNNFTGTALTPDNYQMVRTKMRSYKGENGKTIRVNPTLLVVPPALEGAANQIVNSDLIAPQFFAGGQTQVGSNFNYLKGSAKVLVVPELAGQDTTWYLMDTSKPVKPFLWQQRKAPEFTYLNNPNDLPVFKRNEFEFGIHARGNMAYALWFLAARAIA